MGGDSGVHRFTRAASLAAVPAEYQSLGRLAKQRPDDTKSVSVAHQPAIRWTYQYGLLGDSVSVPERQQLPQRPGVGTAEASQPRFPDAGLLHVRQDGGR